MTKEQILIAELFSGIDKLKDNWDGYDSKAIKTHVISECRKLVIKVKELYPTVPFPIVVPTHEGGLQLEWHQIEKSLSIVFNGKRWELLAVEDCGMASEDWQDRNYADISEIPMNWYSWLTE